MQFRYPARLQPDRSGATTVSFRDLPECLTSGTDKTEALREAGDALEEAIAGRIDDDEPIPVPSRLRAGERLIGDDDTGANPARLRTFRRIEIHINNRPSLQRAHFGHSASADVVSSRVSSSSV